MTGRQLLTDLLRRGIDIVPEGHDLELRGLKSAITADVVAAVRASKTELLVLLAAEKRRDEARAIIDRLRGLGATFATIRDRGEDVLIWFAPTAAATPELRAEVAQYRADIIGLVRATPAPDGHALSADRREGRRS